MRTILCAALAIVVSSAAGAATVDDIQGRILVDRGDGFKRISGPIGARPGTRVMANPGGSATIIYDNGCRELVEPGAVVTVKREGPCQVGGVSPYVAGAVVIGGGAALAIGLSNRSSRTSSSQADRPASP
jgi:hypothetical protein